MCTAFKCAVVMKIPIAEQKFECTGECSAEVAPFGRPIAPKRYSGIRHAQVPQGRVRFWMGEGANTFRRELWAIELGSTDQSLCVHLCTRARVLIYRHIYMRVWTS